MSEEDGMEEKDPNVDPSGIDEMEQRGDELDEKIEETKRDWEQKQEDSSIPGAVDAEPELDEDNPVGGGV